MNPRVNDWEEQKEIMVEAVKSEGDLDRKKKKIGREGK